MISTAGTLVVVIFVVTGGYYLFRLVRDRGSDDRVLDSSHLLMSVAMIITALGWSIAVPAAVQIVVFTAAALWYAYLLLFRPDAVFDIAGSHHSGRPRLLYHAAMMLAMVWMAVIMAPLAGTGTAAVDEMPHSGMSDGMSANLAGAVSGAPNGSTNGAVAGIAAHPWADPVALVIGLGFAVATIWYVTRFVLTAGRADRTSRRRLTDLAAYAVMAAGMAVTDLVVMR